ncbi:MAG: ATP-binding SpoIIE family protein phosphatase, partial [Acidimicrobiales bacterium]
EQALAEAAAQREALAREHQIADELQASLIPDPVFEHDYLQVATYYQAGVEGTFVGGDWYDVIELGGDRTALVIGDVMGRGVKAAAVMGQLRSAVRAYARLDLQPAQVLKLLDPVVEDFGEDHIVTCVYAVYDPTSTTLHYANAGHLPPLLRHPDGSVSRLSRASAPPLGSGNSQFEEQLVRIGEGATVVLYTDGLIERRGSNLENGIDDLARRLRTVSGDLAAQPAALVNGLRPDGPDDDIAVLMARVPFAEPAPPRDRQVGKGGAKRANAPTDRNPPVVAEATLGEGLDVVPSARRLARRWLEGIEDGLVAEVELVLSELVTNAVLHGRPPVVLRMAGDEHAIRVEVEDAGRNLPVRLQHNTEVMTGRGLSLVTSLSSDWGINPAAERGKVVWAELRRGGQGEHGEGPSPLELDAIAASWPADETIERYVIRLGAVPTDLLIAAKAHVDNAVRELTLLGQQETNGGPALTPDMVALVETVTKDFAEARTEIKRQAAAAAGRHLALTNLELHLPLSAAEAGERYLEALDRVDRHARQARLLTLAPPAVHRIFRRWYVTEIIDQLRAVAAGREPRRSRSFAEVLADEVTRLTDELANRGGVAPGVARLG